MKFKIANALSMVANIILSIYNVKFHANTLIFRKVNPDYFNAQME